MTIAPVAPHPSHNPVQPKPNTNVVKPAEPVPSPTNNDSPTSNLGQNINIFA